MPYVQMLIQSMDFPSVDYDTKKDKKENKKSSNFGTPISSLSAEDRANLR